MRYLFLLATMFAAFSASAQTTSCTYGYGQMNCNTYGGQPSAPPAWQQNLPRYISPQESARMNAEAQNQQAQADLARQQAEQIRQQIRQQTEMLRQQQAELERQRAALAAEKARKEEANRTVPTAIEPNGQTLYLRNGQWVQK
jgi:hypothetical protein